MIILVNSVKAFNKTAHPFLIKILNKFRENIDKGYKQKPTKQST